MSYAGYHPQYQQPPPPRQQYNAPQAHPPRPQDRRQQQENPYGPASHQQYQRHIPGPEYENYDQYAHGGYDAREQYNRNERWDQGYYRDQYGANGNQQYHMNDQQLPQSRSYQYDERYQTQQRDRDHPQPPARNEGLSNGVRKQTVVNDKPHRPKADRILTDRPSSPKAVPWDNPFGAFPKKQKEEEKTKADSKDRRSEDKNRAQAPAGRFAGATSSRPSTSQGARPRNDAQRPNTSQSYNAPTQQDPRDRTPLTTDENATRPTTATNTLNNNAFEDPRQLHRRKEYGGVGLPSRPAPQRAATEPVPLQAPAPPQDDLATEWPVTSPVRSQPPPVHNTVFQQRLPRNQEYSSQAPYAGAPLSKPISNESETEMPNFAAMTPGMTESVESAVTLQKPAYQKQTYQAAVLSTSIDSRRQNYTDLQNQTGRNAGAPSFQHPYNRPPSFEHQSLSNGQRQSRDRAEVNQGYQQASDEQNIDYSLPDQGQQYATEQDYRSAPHGFANIHETFDRPDTQRRGYDPRLQSSQSSFQANNADTNNEPYSPHQLDQPTDYRSRDYFQNSVRSPMSAPAQSAPRQYNERTTSYNYRSNAAFPDSDAAHPVPVRPGLMSPPPPRPLQSQANVGPAQPPPSNRQNSEIRDNHAPITVGELNHMRENVRSNPENHELALRFAKRLVEAAKVLASEGGKADPKQTQKNRERYIFDAHKVIKKLVSAGYPDAMFYLADCYGQGQLGLPSDPREAYNLYQSAAKLGHAQSAYRVAVCCELGAQEGGGTKRDHMKAVQYYKRAATLGDTPAMYKMGMILLKGLLGQQPNPREAISWLKRAAERADAENPHALHELGLLYETANSRDVAVRDEAYAYQLFKQAADLGYKHSQFRLGSAFEYGSIKCPIDPRSSIAWYSKAAAQGEHQSEFALSGWYLTGSPGLLEQNDTEAYLWAKKAAMSGLAKAEYAMGYYTEVGIGVNADLEEAKRWYYRAAAQNHPKARERLDDLKRGGGRMQKRRVSRSHVGRQNEGECVVM